MVEVSQLTNLVIDFEHLGEKDLPIFTKTDRSGEAHKTEMSIIFGSNGAGKSTIARNLRQNTENIKFLDINGDEILSDDFSNIFVFDNDFIDKNFKVQGDSGLKPIVLLGGQVDIQEDINRLKDDKNRLIAGKEKSQNKLNNKISEIAGKNEERSSKIKQSGWVSRAEKIVGKKRVTDSVISRIFDISIGEENRDELLRTFDEKNRILEKIDNSNNILGSYENISIDIDVNVINQELSEIPDFHTNDNKLMGLIEKFSLGTSELQRRYEFFADSEENVCPECFQKLTQEYKQEVSSEIYKIIQDLTRESNEEKLSKLKISLIENISFTPEVLELAPQECSLVDEKILFINNCIKDINSCISKKIDNPSAVLNVGYIDWDSLLIEINEAINSINRSIILHNDTVGKKEELRRELLEINDQIAALDVQDLKREIITLESQREVRIVKITDIERDIEDLDIQIQQKELQMKSTLEAAERVNDYLKIVFGHSSIQLRPVEHGYEIINRESHVQPNRLSTGEKNIIALCYFFVSLAANKNFNEPYAANSLIVLDDPISSFDYDNKYGVTALIGYIGKQFYELASRDFPKIIILTHDLSVANELFKIFEVALSGNISGYYFKNGNLISGKFDSVDVYKDILTRMYKKSFEESGEEISANEVRRVWEAFVTFEIGESITDASTSPTVRKYFEEMGEEYKNFLDAYPGRVFINPDSHGANQMRQFNFGLTPILSDEDFSRFVKETLCFMHILSSYHIGSRVGQRGQERIKIKETLDSAVQQMINNN